MVVKINIAAILNDKSNGLRLYSPIFGECEFCYVREDTNDICVKKHNGVIEYFNSEGLYFALGEVMLFPSKSMRDWEKFSWNRGDVLVNSRGLKILFDRWANDNYTSFYAKTVNLVEDGFLDTNLHNLASEKEAKSFIKCIEERFGGKLNLQTLEIQKQTEFKDGDIIKMTWDKYSAIAIFWKYSNFGKGFDSHIFFNIKTKIIEYNIHGHTLQDIILRLATEEEKKQFFSALANKGKAWDAVKKEVVDLKPKYEFKPFDKVLGRNEKGDVWEAELFSHYREKSQYPFCCIGFNRKYCIPYNEETAHLLGTTDDWEE